MAWMHADLFALQEILATMDAIAQHSRQIHGQVHLRRHALVVHIAAHQNDYPQDEGLHIEPCLVVVTIYRQMSRIFVSTSLHSPPPTGFPATWPADSCRAHNIRCSVEKDFRSA